MECEDAEGRPNYVINFFKLESTFLAEQMIVD